MHIRLMFCVGWFLLDAGFEIADQGFGERIWQGAFWVLRAPYPGMYLGLTTSHRLQ